MQYALRRIALAGVFLAWVLPRVLPLLLYPGVYCFDTWFFIGHAESILAHNHIPLLNPFEYFYISHSALYLFAVQLTQFFGTPLIESFRIFAVILIVAGFLAFYTLFRQFLGPSWPSLVAMLFFSVAVDVISQTHCIIQENMALIFLALMLLVSYKITQKNNKVWFTVLPILVVILPLTHHLTTYFTILFSFALLFASLLSQDPIIRKKGTLISLALINALLLLLLLINPVMTRLFLQYAEITLPSLIGIGILAGVVYSYRTQIWRHLQRLNNPKAKSIFIILGILTGTGFFLALLFFYPYDRTLHWIVLKFGYFSILLGLSIASLRVLPFYGNHSRTVGLLIGISILILGLSFLYTGMMTLFYATQNVLRIEVAIGHRHFAFLLIPFATIASIALHRIYCQDTNPFHKRLILPPLALLLLIFSAGGIYNLYQPAGGWYPEYCDHSEISTGIWLRINANAPAMIVTDKRLIQMMEGMTSIGSGQFELVWLNNSYISSLTIESKSSQSTNQNIYFFTSRLSEEYFIVEFLQPPIRFPSSELLNHQNSVAKIYARNQAEIFFSDNISL